MLRKIKDFLREMIFSPSGTATLVLMIMIFVSIFNFINIALLFSDNWWMIPMLLVAFLVPFFIFRAARGGKKYIPSIHLSLPKRYHVATIIFATLLVFFGSTLLKLAFVSGKYVEFPLYSAFFAHRNGNFWNDIYLVFAFCIIPPVLEGLIFRGSILREHDKRGRMTATVFSSLLFALLDFNFELFIPRFFLGVMLCIVVYATESIATVIAIHVLYNFFAIFVEPTFVSVKSVSANVELFVFIIAILTLIMAILLFSHLSRLYKKYSHTKFGDNFIRSTPRERTFWNLLELMTSIPAIACYVIFIIVALIVN